MVRSVKTMLLGVAIMLVGLYIQGEEGINFYGYEVFFGIIGFIITVIAFLNKGNSTDEILTISNEEIERELLEEDIKK
ncbi:hypothetical protein [Halalkalibacter urbisdiaboli]|uniref:hypothetical protein n=1 Tax=Halalkalibacter urbisdiaboli TaxID=1960589 RepID=UPI000B4332E6|nr:hypothetical protein [Halalkalibacter urbisdiaboli]